MKINPPSKRAIKIAENIEYFLYLLIGVTGILTGIIALKNW